jgi:hypothetical protein
MLMNTRAIFGLSILMSLLSSVLAAKIFVWPWLRAREKNQALIALISPHLFLRFIGLSFLVVGVVSPELSAAFAVPAAYGDLIAGILAILATIALSRRASAAIAAVWVFNVWGSADFLFAFYQGPHVRLDPGALGAAFYIPTAIVPPLLITHLLIFQVLFRKKAS